MTNIEGAKKCPGAGMMCVTSLPSIPERLSFKPGFYCPVCAVLCYPPFDGRELPPVPTHDDERTQ